MMSLHVDLVYPTDVLAQTWYLNPLAMVHKCIGKFKLDKCCSFFGSSDLLFIRRFLFNVLVLLEN